MPKRLIEAPGALVGREDFTKDGSIDPAVTNQDANTVSVLPGDGTGGFTRKTDFAAGGPPQRIAAADLDGDRHLDPVLPIVTGNAVALLHGDSLKSPMPSVRDPVVREDDYAAEALVVMTPGFGLHLWVGLGPTMERGE